MPKIWPGGIPTDFVAWLLEALARKSDVAARFDSGQDKSVFLLEVCAVQPVPVVEAELSRIERMGRGEGKKTSPHCLLYLHQKLPPVRKLGGGYNSLIESLPPAGICKK